MYVGFELEGLTKLFFGKTFDFYLGLGKIQFLENTKTIETTLESFLNDDGTLNGDRMQSAWFPDIKADIFISHSHADEKLMIAFAGWLKLHFKLNVFIDSCLWNYSKDLQIMLDEQYGNIGTSRNGSWVDYDSVLLSSSHVHMMLNTALMHMIDNTECIIFVNTPNSVKPKAVIDKVISPWIYSELAMTKLVRKKELKEYRKIEIMFEHHERIYSEKKIPIEYNLKTSHLMKLNLDLLRKWKMDCLHSNFLKNKRMSSYQQKSLDVLYRNLPEYLIK
ncbi:hypothetical protein [Myroides odoratimimus]|uniref:hypothetical protein n=1 Tax=Myroides odoratimimus TaxID=76832 RepID=UPI003100EDF1